MRRSWGSSVVESGIIVGQHGLPACAGIDMILYLTKERESYREGKKVKHRTIANLSQCSAEEIAAIRLALRHKKNLSELTTGKGKSFSQKQGLSIGAVWMVYDMARQLGIVDAFGTTRDGKKGKLQIVIGLLCNEAGMPLSVEVFTRNTQDPKTFAAQIKKVAERFGSQEVTFVGDRGMIKNQQIEQMGSEQYGFHYITAITKPQIEKLLKENVIQLNLFDQELAEVKTTEGLRYVLRRNPARACLCRDAG